MKEYSPQTIFCQDVLKIPLRRVTAFSIVTCISLFSPAEERSKLVKVPAFCSHLFFEKVKTTTGRRDFLRRRPMRWVYTVWSPWRAWECPPPWCTGTARGGPPLCPPRPAGPPRWPRCGAAALAPSRWRRGRPAASRSLTCLGFKASPASLYL